MRGELDPAVGEGTLFVAARTYARGMLSRGFRGEEEFGDGAERGEEVSDCGRAHKGECGRGRPRLVLKDECQWLSCFWVLRVCESWMWVG